MDDENRSKGRAREGSKCKGLVGQERRFSSVEVVVPSSEGQLSLGEIFVLTMRAVRDRARANLRG